MFILKGQDFSIKVDSLSFSYWDNRNIGEESFEVECLNSNEKGLIDKLIDLDTLADYEDLSLSINDKDFSFTFESKDNDIIIQSLELTKKDILEDSIFTKDELNTIDENRIDTDCLVKKFKTITFTEFKKLFELKGTKKYFVDNCPDGFYLTSYNHVRLNKDVQEGKYLVSYECDLGKAY